MAYLKELNTSKVRTFSILIVTIVMAATIGLNEMVNTISAYINPDEKLSISIGSIQLKEMVFSVTLKAVGVIVFGVIANWITSLFDRPFKHALVYWPVENITEDLARFCTKYEHLKSQALMDKYPDAFDKIIKPKDRATAWYQKIYLPVKEENAVEGANKEFLLYREVLVFSFALAGVYLVLCFVNLFCTTKIFNWQGLLAALLCLLLVKIAAYQKSKSLIANSLAAAIQKL